MKTTPLVSRRCASLLAASGLLFLVAACSNKNRGSGSDSRTVIGAPLSSWFADDTARDAAPSRSATRLAAVDFDGDGKLDLVRSQEAGGVDALLQLGGRLERRDTIATAIGGRTVAAADFDGDGDGDVAVAYADGRDVLYVNTGSDVDARTLPSTKPSAVSTRIVFAELDPKSPGLEILRLRDQTCELLARRDTESAYVLAGTFGARGAQFVLAAIDVDGDGDDDVVRDDASNGLIVFENNAGSFVQRSSYFPKQPAPVRDIAVIEGRSDQPDFALAFGPGGAAALLRDNGDWQRQQLVKADVDLVASRDFDRDGHHEVLAVGGRTLRVLTIGAPSTGEGHEGETLSYALASSATALVVADFDGDPCFDVYVGGSGADTYLQGAPKATFIPALDRDAALADIDRSSRVASGDFDGDGWIDIARASTKRGALSWRRNQAWAEYGKSREILADLAIEAMTAFDVDADKDVDLIFALRDGPIHFVRNQGKGDFETKKIETISAAKAIDLTAVDIDRDGKIDLVVRTSTRELKYLHNSGSGRFADASDKLPLPKSDVHAYLLEDLDGDGDLDYVVAHGSTGEISLVDGLADGAFDTKATALPARGLGAKRIVAVPGLDGKSLLVASDGIDGGLAWIGPSAGRRWADLSDNGLSGPIGATPDLTLIDADEDGDLDIVRAGVDGLSVIERSGDRWLVRRALIDSLAHDVQRVIAVDDDRDGDVDVWAIGSSSRRVRNRSVDVAMPFRPRIGRAVPLEFALRDPGAQTIPLRVFTSFTAIAGGTQGRFGMWGLDPTKQVELRSVRVRGPHGGLRLDLEIPVQASLLGHTFYVQTLNGRGESWRSGPRVGRRIAP